MPNLCFTHTSTISSPPPKYGLIWYVPHLLSYLYHLHFLIHWKSRHHFHIHHSFSHPTLNNSIGSLSSSFSSKHSANSISTSSLVSSPNYRAAYCHIIFINRNRLIRRRISALLVLTRKKISLWGLWKCTDWRGTLHHILVWEAIVGNIVVKLLEPRTSVISTSWIITLLLLGII